VGAVAVRNDLSATKTSEDRSGLQMSLPARAENVAVVRHALAGLANRVGMDEGTVADLKTVVTEACMNVVVHAYPEDRPGPLEVEAVLEDEGLTVAVRDYGAGIRPRPDVDRPSLRIGLALIAALSSSFEISGGVDRGTEIRMHLKLRESPDGAGTRSEDGGTLDSDATVLRVGPSELVGPILGCALAALAARHQITVDRLSDAMLLSDAISADAPRGFADGQVRLSIADRPQGIELRIGPMRSGAGAELVERLRLPELGASLDKLADELQAETGEDGEYLVVAFAALAG